MGRARGTADELAGWAIKPPRPAAPAGPTHGRGIAADGPPSIFNHSRFDHEPAAVPVDAFAPQKMLHLAGWPEMRLLPPDQLLPVARICALLAHSPSVGFLVHRRLGMPREDAMALLFRMHAQGLVRVSGGDAVPEEPVSEETVPTPEPSAPAAASRAKPSIWTRMLERLLH